MTEYIINSMLDTDLYKFFMQYIVFKKFPDVEVEYTFKNRTKDIILKDDDYTDRIMEEIHHMAKLRFSNANIKYLNTLYPFSRGYNEYLKLFQFDPNNVVISKGNKGQIVMKICGTWLNTILFETPTLAIPSELYSTSQPGYSTETLYENLENKFNILKDYNKKFVSNYLKYAEFGARRRSSFEHQDIVVKECKKQTPLNFVGTSNVYFSEKHNVKGIGTQAHEYYEAMQSLTRLKDSQKFGLQTWADVYRGNNGIALTDTLGINAFLNDFDQYFAKLFDGGRQDSGDPYWWCHKFINHYKSLGIDPRTKQAVFSDGLNFPKAIGIHKEFFGQINMSFGIGTHLTNDCGVKPLQIVIKMTKCNGNPVAKIPDSPGKQMCENKEYLKYLATQFSIPEDRI